MSMSSTSYLVSYAGNGVTTAFATPYFLVTADIKAVRIAADSTETVLVNPTHFSVSGAGTESGGSLTMVTAPATGETLVVYRSPPLTQLVDLVDNDPLPSSTLETEFDKLTMIVQRLSGRVDKALRISDWKLPAASLSLPPPQADKYFKWNTAGDAVEYGNLAFESVNTVVAPILADLRSVAGTFSNELAVLGGISSIGDGGGGMYFWSGASTATDDSFTTIKPTAVAGAGRWVRKAFNNINSVGLGNMEVSATGNFGFGGAASAAKVDVFGVASKFTAYFKGFDSAGASHGVSVDAGTSTADTPFRIRTANAATTLVDSNGTGLTTMRFAPAQVPNAGANSLDDYEEGTFSPTIQGASSAGVGTYSAQEGYYTKIGNLVTCTIVLAWTAHTGTGSLVVAGLPFTSASSTNNHTAASGYSDGLAMTGHLTGRCSANTSTIQLYASSNGSIGTIPMDTNASIYMAFTYRAA